ncbi:ECF-type sigma factor [Marinicella sp. W31]|uniref:ECF-type sigma factor n=1 Tax=Marinicella sp. W31 TaxID=3023713 RepID=UPI003756D46E
MGTENITSLIRQWQRGDDAVINELMPLIYDQLHDIAWKSHGVKGGDITMRPTVLVNEAFIKLQKNNHEVVDRTHFFAAAALTMRHIMVDFIRHKQRDKRGGGKTHVVFDNHIYAEQTSPSSSPDIVDLNDALENLEKMDARKAQMVELHYFAGLSYTEIAEVQSVSAATVGRELKFAKAWLANELQRLGVE